MDSPVRDILADKGGRVVTAQPGERVSDAVQRMNEAGIGALVVVDGDRPIGIFTERDVLTRVVAARRDPDTTEVGDVMTRALVAISPSTMVREAMMVVTERRLRHLPVMDGGQLAGMISIGDLTRWVVRDQQHQIDDLLLYITRG